MTVVPSTVELRKLVHAQRNKELVVATSGFTSLVDWRDKSNKSFLHLAAKFGNIDLMRDLLKMQPSLVNSTSQSGKTPLMYAISNNQTDAARLLLDANADLTIEDTAKTTALSMVIRQRAPADITRQMIQALRKTNVSLKNIAILFRRYKCTTGYALTLHHPPLLRELLLLKKSMEEISSKSYVDQAIRAGTRESIANLVILINYGPDCHLRKRRVFKMISKAISNQINVRFPFQKVPDVKTIIRYFMELNAFDEYFVFYFARRFSRGSQASVRWLMETNVVNYVKDKCGQNLLAYLFANSRVDVFKLLENIDFDVNVRVQCGYTALHFAAESNHWRRIKYLLSKGADPNIADDSGTTPIFKCSSTRCLLALLKAGADIQQLKKDRCNMLDFRYRGHPITQNYVLPYMALVEAQGVLIHRYTYTRIRAYCVFYDYFQDFRVQIEWMQQRTIFQDVTLFRVLTDEPRNIVPYVAKLDDRTKLTNWHRERALAKYYYVTLKGNLKKAVNLYNLECKAASYIAKISGDLLDTQSIPTKLILSYLTSDDLDVFA